MSFYATPGWNYGQQGATQNAYFYGVHGTNNTQSSPAQLHSGGSMRRSNGSFYGALQRGGSFYGTNSNLGSGMAQRGGVAPQPATSTADRSTSSTSSNNTYYPDEAFSTTPSTAHGGAADQKPAADDANARDTPPPLQRKNSSGRLLRRKVSFSGVPSTLPPEVEPRSETTTPKRLGTRRLSGADSDGDGDGGENERSQQQQQLYYQQQFPSSLPYSFPPLEDAPHVPPQQQQQLTTPQQTYDDQQDQQWPLLGESTSPQHPSQPVSPADAYGWQPPQTPQQQQQQPPYYQQTLRPPYSAPPPPQSYARNTPQRPQQLPQQPQYQQRGAHPQPSLPTPPQQAYYAEQPPQYVTDPQQIHFTPPTQAASSADLPSQTYYDTPQQQRQQQPLEASYSEYNLAQLQPTLATSGSARRSSLGSLSRRNSQMRMFPMSHPMHGYAPGMQNFSMMPFPRPVYRPTFNVYRNMPYGVYNANLAMYQRQVMPNYY